MEDLNKLKNEIKNSKDTEQINNILIQLSKNVNQDVLHLIDFLIRELDANRLNKINLNLIFLIGELGRVTRLEPRYLDYLINSYYNSDRWVRNEIVQAIFKLIKLSPPDKSILKLVEDGLKEEYEPIQENSLKVLSLYDELPERTIRLIISKLKLAKSNLIELTVKILNKAFKNEEAVYQFLNSNQNYKILNKEIIRIILTEFFPTIQQLEKFRERITNSDWESEIKAIILPEIKTLERIYLKR